MVNKSNLSEEDVKERYITPAIREKGWKPTDYRMEYEYTDGRITVLKNGTKRGKRKKIDYLLNYRENVPIAIIEAKDLKIMKPQKYHSYMPVTVRPSSNMT